MPRLDGYRSHTPATYQAGFGEESFSAEEFGEAVSVQIVDDWDTVNDDLEDDYEDLHEIDMPSYDDDI